ncbi:MAG: bifunctional 4-hydroxy-2-oxoglutarate aldolase/2-dehydro-3-deoxy-phosphogluconate aldolase [Chloroflexi bacterium]|nr:MAG: bifunctional 4-hydroxy-2-oxoglutarate aldolase/2-dehydro-3-deoxy-phosphogluconate aldolase [Chloroflexota bacterium]
MQRVERRASVAETVDWIKREGIIPIVRGDFPAERVLEIGDALLAAPILCMEVTMNTPGATDLIALLAARYGTQMCIGAGTVRTVAQLNAAVDAGAQFTLSPSLVLAVVERAKERGVLHIPGVFTASEAETTWQAGCPLLKLFPAEQGGPAYLKALRAPLDDIAFVPTGGVSAENAAAWRKAGAVALGVGSTLITGPNQPMADLISRARGLRAAWEGS